MPDSAKLVRVKEHTKEVLRTERLHAYTHLVQCNFDMYLNGKFVDNGTAFDFYRVIANAFNMPADIRHKFCNSLLLGRIGIDDVLSKWNEARFGGLKPVSHYHQLLVAKDVLGKNDLDMTASFMNYVSKRHLGLQMNISGGYEVENKGTEDTPLYSLRWTVFDLDSYSLV